MSRSDTAVIIPVYNEGNVIGSTLTQVLAEFPLVVCVDDGSTDDSVREIEKTSALLVKHPIHRGYGAALQTGIEFALQNPRVRYLATIENDGRYNIRNLHEMLARLKDEDLDIVLGSRFARRPNKRRLLLRAVMNYANRSAQTKLTDSTRMRVFTRKFGESLHIESTNRGTDLEILGEIGQGEWHYTEWQLREHNLPTRPALG